MAASPHVLVQNGSGSFINPDNTGDLNFPAGANVTPGNTISIKLESIASVGQWRLQVLGTDESTLRPVLSGVDSSTWVVSTPSTIVTFAIPAGVAGRTYIFQSIVNNGGSAYTTTFGIYTLTSGGFRVGAVGERFENDPTFGWARTINQFIKHGGGGGGGGGTSTPLSSVFYADKNTTVPIPDRNGSQATPFGSITEWLLATSGGTLYIVPEDYAEGVLNLAKAVTLIGMDTAPIGSAQSGGLQIPATNLGQVSVASEMYPNLLGVHLSSLEMVDNTAGVSLFDCIIFGAVTGDGSLNAVSTILFSSSITANFVDLTNCIIADNVTFNITFGGVASFWDSSFGSGVVIVFSGEPGVVRIDRNTHHSWVKNGVTLINGSLSVISGPLQVWCNGSVVGDNVGVLNITTDDPTSVEYLAPTGGNDYGTINLGLSVGFVKSIRIPLALVDVISSKVIPENSVIHSCVVNIITPYTGGTTIRVGRSESLNLIQGTTDNSASTQGLYNVIRDTDWGLPGEVLVTIHNSDSITEGSGFCTILYSRPG
jgi:hypothetical protein